MDTLRCHGFAVTSRCYTSHRDGAALVQSAGHVERSAGALVRGRQGPRGYSLQANVKTKDGPQHAARDAQFRYINRVVPRKPFAQRFTETLGTDPRRCPTCGDTMDLALIYHPVPRHPL